MKWAYSIKQKTKAAFLIAIVLGLVLSKNLLDSNNVNQLGSSFSAVYEDRLLVESYIYQLSGHLYQKKMLVDNCYYTDNAASLQDQLLAKNTAIATLLQTYETTDLTEAEAKYFGALKQTMDKIRNLENQYLARQGTGQEMAQAKALMDAQYSLAASHLNQLSGIQVEEGKRLNEKSKKIIAGSTILTNFELVVVVGLGIMIQMLILASKSKLSKFPQKPMLN
ncbi:MCP four helix bundle domain-containing protein [Rufibacter psychrotolerans]|uniref:MCP four helix bundle domain-containing protein n=1 Tax=Rufibacter psychrotolerans TaxID=2812556 RepID=UPI0019679123|nr:MCP four helix bundle domain-containing protein [Rufibacter sp. SYSU D00308]